MGNTSEIEMIAVLAKAVGSSPFTIQNIMHSIPEYKEMAKRDNFVQFDTHCIMQTCGNTSCGWGGIAGQAFTNYWAVVIEYPMAGVAVVWVHRIAYVCQIDVHFKDCLTNGNVPEWDRLTQSKLNIIWKASK